MACGIMNRTVKQKKSKSMDKNFWWLADRVEQGQFNICWAPGCINLADYFSKKHPASHHKKVRPIYLHIEGQSPSTLQGCDRMFLSTPSQTSQPRSEHSNANEQEPVEPTVDDPSQLTTNGIPNGTMPKTHAKWLKILARGITSQLSNSLLCN